MQLQRLILVKYFCVGIRIICCVIRPISVLLLLYYYPATDLR